MNTRAFGWIPDIPDIRDLQFRFIPPADLLLKLPPKEDLRPGLPEEIYDQKNLGSCAANAGVVADEYCQRRQRGKSVRGSRLFLYRCTRKLEGTVPIDAGATIRDTLKAMNKWGIPPENLWEYDIERFTEDAPPEVYIMAEKHQAVVYSRVEQNLQHLKVRIAMGYPIMYGFSVYESFNRGDVARTGKVEMPNFFDRMIGGHANVLVGYDDEIEHFLSRNSYGKDFGDHGYLWLPYEYVTNSDLAADFWTLMVIE